MSFSLIKKSGPFELWEAHWKVSDSTYEYHANYLIHVGNRRLLKRDVEVDREGVFMGEASASGRFLMLDYGCCPGPRGLSVLTEAGRSILDGSYIGDAEWKGDTLVYFRPKPVAARPRDKCTAKGLTSHPARRTFFIDGKTVDAGETRLFCGQ